MLKNDVIQGSKELPTETYGNVRRRGSDEVDAAGRVFQHFQKGFSLVELILAVSIASLLMVGMSFFFSSSMVRTFEAQRKVTATQEQFVVNAIVREKFKDVTAVLNAFVEAP